MSKFRLCQKVVITEDGELKRGTIQNFSESAKVAVIILDNGEWRKVPYEQVAVAPEEPKKEDEPVKKDMSEKELINLTPAEFRRITAEIIGDFIMKVGPFSGVAFTLFVAELHKKLFFEESDESGD